MAMLHQERDGDAFVAAVKIAVGAEIRAAFDGIAGIFLEDTPFFTKNDAGDEPFLLAAQQGFAQRPAESAALSRGAVAVDDFDGGYAGLFGLAEVGEEEAAGFVDSGQANFDIESFERGHGGAREHCA